MLQKNFKAFKNLKMLIKIKYKIISYLALNFFKKNEGINSEKKSSLIITKSFSTPKELKSKDTELST